MDSGMQLGTCVNHRGSLLTRGTMDVIQIYGKDEEGKYWIHGHLRHDTWELIRKDFSGA
jgi:hypothetical protein